MSKVYNYMIMTVGLIILFTFAGLPTGMDSILSYFGLTPNPSDVSLGNLANEIFAIFSIGVGTGIAISFFTKTSPESYIVAPLALSLFSVMSSTFISIINYTRDFGYVYYLTYMIFIPLLFGFFIALVNYWRGSGG